MKPVQKRGVDGVRAVPRETAVPAKAARSGEPGPAVPWASRSAGWAGSSASGTGQSRNPKEVTTISELANVCMSLCVCACMYAHGECLHSLSC